MTTWFTADTHFGHKGALRFGARTQFKDTVEMDVAMIANWNNVIQPEDTVYHLGDLSFANETRTLEVLSVLHGRKHWVSGNHDHSLLKKKAVRAHFLSIQPFLEHKFDGQRVTMCHFPMLTWDKAHYGAWMLHGHSHGNCKYPFEAKILDVGVDVWNFAPISFDQIKEHMVGKKFTAIDHHVEKINLLFGEQHENV